ncbi:hypothetical protein [Nocardia asteroides]
MKLRTWLITGGDLAECRHQRAAAELLDVAGLLDRREVRAHIDTRLVTDTDDRPHVIARDWRALAAGDLGPLGFDDHRRPPRGSPTIGSGPQSLPGCASARFR